jgi:hypothetical protein
MEKRYVMLWNGGVYHGTGGRNVFTLEELKREFHERLYFTKDRIRVSEDWSVYDDDEFEYVSLSGLFEILARMGGMGEKYYIHEQDLAERGDDFVEASLVSLEE